MDAINALLSGFGVIVGSVLFVIFLLGIDNYSI